MKRIASILLFGGTLMLSFGCGQAVSTSQENESAVDTAIDSKYLLPSEPQGAVAVTDLRKQAKDGDEIVVSGRIGGGIDPWIDGRAAFILVDPVAAEIAAGGVEICSDEDCSCLGDKLADATALVKFVDADGKTLPVDARKLLGVKAMQIVVVKGVARRVSDDNLAVHAEAIYVRR